MFSIKMDYSDLFSDLDRIKLSIINNLAAEVKVRAQEMLAMSKNNIPEKFFAVKNSGESKVEINTADLKFIVGFGDGDLSEFALILHEQGIKGEGKDYLGSIFVKNIPEILKKYIIAINSSM